MAKVENLRLAGQTAVFAFVGEKEFDENGITEIDHPELLKQLESVNGFRVLPEQPKEVPPTKPKTEEKPPKAEKKAEEPVKNEDK